MMGAVSRFIDRTRLFPASLAAVAVMGIAQPVLACSGQRMVSDPNDPEYAARVVFTGTAVRRDDEFPGPIISSLDPYYWTFVVDGVELGDVGRRFTVASARSGASCGVDFTLGQRYRVVAWGGDVQGKPLVTGGDAELLPQLANNPPVEGEFGPPLADVLLAHALDPFTWLPIVGVLVLLVSVLMSIKPWRRRPLA